MNFDWLHEGDPLFPWLTRRQRLVVVYAAAITAVVLVYTVLYNYGMRTLEGHDHSLFRSLQTVVETMTTTGYGADAPWSTPLMNVFVVFIQLTGVVIGFATLRVLIIPLFERAPLDLGDRLTAKDDHVVVAEYRRDSGVLLDELDRLDVDYVLIESDVEEAKRLSDDGYQVIHGDPERGETLEDAMIADADVLVTDAGDRNASVALTARRYNEALRVVALTDDPGREPALREVGVDAVVSPPALIGRRLGRKSSTGLDSPAGDAVVGDVRVRELVVRRDSPLRGVRIGDSFAAENQDLTVVAAWIDGQLRLPPDPEDRITQNSVLVVAGTADAFADVRAFATSLRPLRRHTNVVVAGMGVGGRAALDALADDADATTIDREDGRHVDVVGDVRDPETFATAGIEDATALVVTVDDDATALLAVAVARTMTDDIDVLARVTDTEKAPSAFDAGADYVLSVQRVSARLLAREIRGEDVLAPVGQLRLVRVDASSLAGSTLEQARRGTDDGYVFVGVERDGRFVSTGTTEIAPDDRILVAGTDATIREFERQYA